MALSLKDKPHDITTCTQCWEVNESNHESVEDDLLVCVKTSCDKKHRIMCRECMRSSHKKKKSHKLQNDPNNFIGYKEWYNLLSIQKSKPDGALSMTVKSCGKSAISGSFGVVAAYTLAEKSVMAVVKEIPKDLSKKSLQKYATKIITEISKSEASKGVLMKNMAKGQAAINGLMFAIECGYNLVQYKYHGNMSYDEFMRRNKKAGFAYGSATLGGMIGGGIGLCVAGPGGAAIGSFIGGIVFDCGARKCFDAVSPDERQKQIETALIRFGYSNERLESLLQKPNIFNKNELESRYRTQVYFHHPDGALSTANLSGKEKQERWVQFYAMYELLLVIVKQRDDKKYKKSN